MKQFAEKPPQIQAKIGTLLAKNPPGSKEFPHV
jgi:hypothetical protein